MKEEDEYPIVPMVEFTEDEWTTIYEGHIVESSIYSHLVSSNKYGRFWIPKQFVRLKKKETE